MEATVKPDHYQGPEQVYRDEDFWIVNAVFKTWTEAEAWLEQQQINDAVDEELKDYEGSD